MNKIKKPAWVLFDELHIEVSINTRMAVGDRTKLRKALKSKKLSKAIVDVISINAPIPPTETPQVKIAITA